MEDVSPLGFVVVLGVALLCGLFIAQLYRYFFSARSTGSQIHRAFPLLAVSVTAIFITIQFSLPLSLGLIGALSIVRFRTPIKEPEEIGFLMLVIASSLICATFNYGFLALLLLVSVAGLLVLRSGWPSQSHEDGLVVITLDHDQYMAKFDQIMELLLKNTRRGRIDSVSKTADSAIVTYSFRRVVNTTVKDLQTGLDELVGHSTYDIFFNQQRVA